LSRAGGALSRRLLTACVGVLALTAILSADLVYSTIYQKLEKGFAGPSISVRNYAYEAVKREVDVALAQCGLRRNSPRLIIDDYTYPVVEASYKLIPFTYTLELSRLEAARRAKKLGSAGIVVRCLNLGADTKKDLGIIETGAICCAKF